MVFKDTGHHRIMSLRRKKINVKAMTPPVYCLESFLAVLGVRGEKTQAEPNGPPQLRKQSWETRKAKG